MDINAIQEAIARNRQETGQRIAEIPTFMQNNPSPANDAQVKAMQQSKNQKILELYEHDKALAERYANPQSEVYLADPYAREKARAIQNQATAGEVLDFNTQIDSRKATLQEALDKGLQMMEYGIRAKQVEGQMLQNELDNAIRLQEMQERRAQQDTGSEDLSALFDAISGFQTKVQSAKPIAQGRVANKKDLTALSKKYPGMKVNTSKNKDGTINYTVVNPAAPQLTPQEMELANNPNRFAQQLLAATIAKNPKSAPQASAIISALIPKTESFGYGTDEYLAGVQGQPRTPENEKRFQEHLVAKNVKETNQLVNQPGFLGSPIGAQSYLVNKNTGAIKQVDRPGFDVGQAIAGLFGLNTGTRTGGASSTYAGTKPPSYFIPD